MVESIAIGCSRRLLDDGPIRLANAATDGLLVNVKSDVVHVEHGISSASVSIAERYGVDGADRREAADQLQRALLCIGLLSLLTGNFSERPGAVQGAWFVRGGGESFPVLKRFSGAHPGRRGPFWNIDWKGKEAGSDP